MDHQALLEKVCRTCKNKIKLYDKYRKAKTSIDYHNEILALFKIDVKKEDSSVFPKFICESCKQKFERCHKDISSASSPDTLPDFQPHNDSDCDICFRPLSKQKNKGFKLKIHTGMSDNQKVSMSISSQVLSECSIEEAAIYYDFVKVPQSVNDDRTFVNFTVNDKGNVVTKYCITVFRDNSWSLSLYGNNIDSETTKSLPSIIDTANALLLFSKFSQFKVCEGNIGFEEIIKHKIEKGTEYCLKGKDGDIKGEFQNEHFIKATDCMVIRSSTCDIIFVGSDSMRCQKCNSYRKTLISAKRRIIENNSKSVAPNTPNTFLSREHLEVKAKSQQLQIKDMKRQKLKCDQTIEKLVKSQGISVDGSSDEVFREIVNSNKSPFDENSPQTLLWEHQKKYCSMKSAKNMRWHPVMIRWCISLYLKSPSTYQHLKSSGFMKLPDRTTLLKYTNYTDPVSGFNTDVLMQLQREILNKKWSGDQMKVALIFDEMKIKSGLVFSRSTGKMIGFCDMGEINNILEDFRITVEEEKEHREIATHVLTFLVRGLFSSLNFPFAYFAAQSFRSDQLAPCVWEGVRVLECVGLQVHCFVSDGASPNRRFYKLHPLDYGPVNISEDGVMFWADNIYADYGDERKIYFICDVPHLIKTIRNNMSNSHAHAKTRNLMLNDKSISWQHIIAMFKEDYGLNQKNVSGLRQTKLTTDHVFLDARSRMTVSLAAQVLSHRCYTFLRMQNNPETVSTRQLIWYCNKFFDCLNVRKLTEGTMKRNPDLEPYKSATDMRFKWLKEDFLNFINTWYDQTQAVQGVSKDDKSRLCLSVQTIEGIRITVNSFVNMIPKLLTDGNQSIFFLSDKINQDCLEEHFARQRMRGGTNENPTLYEYGYNELKLQVAKSESIQVMRGNTRGKVKDNTVAFDINDETELPRKKAKK